MRESVSGRVEDYLKAVYDVVEQKGYARIKDISKELGVRPSTVVEMMRKLHGNGLVVYERYGGITLTPQGRKLQRLLKKGTIYSRSFLR